MKQIKIIKKKRYEKPTMVVYELQHRTMLLAGSNGNGGDMPGGVPAVPF